MKEELYNLLDRYFLEELSETEIQAFQSEVAKNSELQEEFFVRKLAKTAFQRKEVMAFKQKHEEGLLKTIDSPPKAKTRTLTYAKWLIAASILFLTGFFLFPLLSQSPAERLFVKYDIKELYPRSNYALINEGLLHKGIVNSEDFDELKKGGLTAYETKDWDLAIILLEKYLEKAIPSDEETPDEINLTNLYLGRAFLEKGNMDKAIELYQKADQGITDLANYGLLRELIRWQLALAHLKKEDIPNTKSTLELLQGAQHETIRKNATDLLNQLK